MKTPCWWERSEENDAPVGADKKKSAVTQLTTVRNCGEQNDILVWTIHENLEEMDYNTSRLQRVSLLSAKNRNLWVLVGSKTVADAD